MFHAGDGNLHPNISFDRRDPDELRRVLAAGSEILEFCVGVGGVITGEHGIGTEKRDFMGLVFGDDDLDAMLPLRPRLDDIVAGKLEPEGGEQARVFAQLCYRSGQHARAVDLFARAFSESPEMHRQYYYEAAQAAADRQRGAERA